MIEYKEAQFKNGKHVIFCKLEDLLKEFYKEDRIEDIQNHLEPNGKDWIIHCPFCAAEGHRKHKLYIDSDLSRGYCFVCHRIYINIDDEVKVNVKVRDFLDRTGQFKPISLGNEGLWTLDKYNFEFDDYSESGVNYLIGRNPFLRQLWKPLGIKFFNDNPVLPFKTPDNELLYYQLRFKDAGKDEIRYFFPPIKAKPPYILQTSEADPTKFIIVEGIFDAIAAYIQCGGKYTIAAVMGSDISDYQIEYIKNWYMPRKFLVWMDDTELSKKICNRLKVSFDYAYSNILKSEGPDPEEIMMGKLRTGGKINWITESTGNIKTESGLSRYLKERINNVL